MSPAVDEALLLVLELPRSQLPGHDGNALAFSELMFQWGRMHSKEETKSTRIIPERKRRCDRNEQGGDREPLWARIQRLRASRAELGTRSSHRHGGRAQRV